MSALILNIDQNRQPQDVLDLFKKSNLKRGDKISVESSRSFNAVGGLIFLMTLIGLYFHNDKREKNKKHTEKLVDDIFKKYPTVEELEKHIEEEYGISIALESPDKEYEKEHKEFLEFSSLALGMKYDDDEPDISHLKGIEPNPKFNLND